MALTHEEIVRLAALSGFRVESAQALKEEIEDIIAFAGLAYIADNMTEKTDVTKAYLRADIPTEPLSRDKALKNAPTAENGFFVLPGGFIK